MDVPGGRPRRWGYHRNTYRERYDDVTQTIAATRRRPEHSVLGLGRFLPGYDFALHDLVVMSSYLVAQALIAAGVLRILRTERW